MKKNANIIVSEQKKNAHSSTSLIPMKAKLRLRSFIMDNYNKSLKKRLFLLMLKKVIYNLLPILSSIRLQMINI